MRTYYRQKMQHKIHGVLLPPGHQYLLRDARGSVVSRFRGSAILICNTSESEDKRPPRELYVANHHVSEEDKAKHESETVTIYEFCSCGKVEM